MKRGGSLVLVTVLALGAAGCNSAEEGTVYVETSWGKIVKVHGPGETFTTMSPGAEAFPVTLRTFTETTTPRVTSRDNAALTVPISVTAATISEKVEDYVRKFGFSDQERHDRRNAILHGLIQTEARNAFAEFGAYEVYANQEQIQKRISEALRPQLAEQLYLNMESVQIGNPDFLDDRIEQAASAVVANEKMKQSEEAALAAAKVAAERKQVEALTYANPALLQIKLLELQLDIERARADGISKHQGPLTLVTGDSRVQPQIQIPTR